MILNRDFKYGLHGAKSMVYYSPAYILLCRTISSFLKGLTNISIKCQESMDVYHYPYINRVLTKYA